MSSRPIGRLIRNTQRQLDVLDDVAAQRRSQQRRDQVGQAEHRHELGALHRRDHGEDQRHAQRLQHAAAQALQDPEDDQALDVPGQAAQRRAEHEAAQREHVQALHADALAQEAAQRDHHRQRHDVRRR